MGSKLYVGNLSYETTSSDLNTMFAPQDLPGRYGRVVKAIDHLLSVLGCESVIAGGWAVWHHGYLARLTQDIDIVLPKDRVAELLPLLLELLALERVDVQLALQ